MAAALPASAHRPVRLHSPQSGHREQRYVDGWVELDPLSPFATVHLKQELEALLQRPVDLVRLRERMNPALRQAILREGVSA